MRISYDPEVDALYVRLVEGEHQCRSMILTDDISLNIGQDELLVGIEVLDAKRVLGQGNIPAVVLEDLPPVLRAGPSGDYEALARQLKAEIERAYARAGSRGERRGRCSFDDFTAGYIAAHMSG